MCIRDSIHTCRDSSERTLDLFDFQEVKLVIYLFRLNYSLKLSPYYHQDMLRYNPFFKNKEENCILFLVMETAYSGALSHQLTGNEQGHVTLRKVIVQFEASNPQIFARMVVAINQKEFSEDLESVKILCGGLVLKFKQLLPCFKWRCVK